MRYDYDSMYSIGASMGMKPASAERMMHSMRESGIITPDSFTEDYRLTERALELWSMTDEYMLSLDLGDLEL